MLTRFALVGGVCAVVAGAWFGCASSKARPNQGEELPFGVVAGRVVPDQGYQMLRVANALFVYDTSKFSIRLQPLPDGGRALWIDAHDRDFRLTDLPGVISSEALDVTNGDIACCVELMCSGGTCYLWGGGCSCIEFMSACDPPCTDPRPYCIVDYDGTESCHGLGPLRFDVDVSYVLD